MVYKHSYKHSYKKKKRQKQQQKNLFSQSEILCSGWLGTFRDANLEVKVSLIQMIQRHFL